MILGGAVSFLLLFGGPQAPPEDRPMSGDGYLAEYPIEIGDPWDMGGGGGFKFGSCVGPCRGTGEDGKTTWGYAADGTMYYGSNGLGWSSRDAAKTAMKANCRKCTFI